MHNIKTHIFNDIFYINVNYIKSLCYLIIRPVPLYYNNNYTIYNIKNKINNIIYSLCIFDRYIDYEKHKINKILIFKDDKYYIYKFSIYEYYIFIFYYKYYFYNNYKKLYNYSRHIYQYKQINAFETYINNNFIL